jgi:hypothetical protein
MCIMWGWQGASVNFGKIDRQHCPTCEKEQDFILSMTYKYSNVFWIPLFSWGNDYVYHCQVCQRGFKMKKNGYQLYPITDEKNPEPWITLTADPNSAKPWYHRFGWVIPVGIFVLILLISWVYEHWMNPPDL